MRFLRLILLSLCLSFFTSTCVLAASIEFAEGEEDLSKPMTQSGEIAKVNPILGTFSIDGRAYKLAGSAQIYVDHLKKTLNEFKDGDTVEVVYFFRKNGVHNAVKLTRLKAGEPKPAK
jgi:hypothetical protein